MSTDRDTTRIVRSWLEEGVTALPDRVLDAVLDQVPSTSQRRPMWSARRFSEMNNAWKLAIAAAAVVVVALVGINLLPGNGGIVAGPGPSPTPTPSPSPTAAPSPSPSTVILEGPLEAGTYTVAPFWHGEAPGDYTIRFTYTVPDGWAGIAGSDVVLADASGGNLPPGGAGLGGNLGGGLYSDPCWTDPNKGPTVIPVGPTVDDFATALVDHPLLDVTTPVDVTLAGYSGKYVDLQVPSDITACTAYYPWDPNIYAQGPGHRWHLWILDVKGMRVVVQSTDYPGTSPAHQAELRAMVDSIKIDATPTSVSTRSPSPSP